MAGRHVPAAARNSRTYHRAVTSQGAGERPMFCRHSPISARSAGLACTVRRTTLQRLVAGCEEIIQGKRGRPAAVRIQAATATRRC